jgi:hypothetical protein
MVLTFILKLYSTTQTFTTRTHTHPYEYMYANPTPMSTSEGLSTARSGDSRSHQWRLIVDGNIAYHLTHNVGKSQNKSRKRCCAKVFYFTRLNCQVQTAMCFYSRSLGRRPGSPGLGSASAWNLMRIGDGMENTVITRARRQARNLRASSSPLGDFLTRSEQ